MMGGHPSPPDGVPVVSRERFVTGS
jgi:hypothetical protein